LFYFIKINHFAKPLRILAFLFSENVETLGLSWSFVACYALFNHMVWLWHPSSRTWCYLQSKNAFVEPLPNAGCLRND